MRSFLSLATAAMALLATGVVARPAPLIVQPGDEGSLIITHKNTVNSTGTPAGTSNAHPLKIRLLNNLNSSAPLKAYVNGKDANGAVMFLGPSGQWYYPDPKGSKTPVQIDSAAIALAVSSGPTTEFSLPDYISSARVWVAEGELKFYTMAGPADGKPQIVEPSFANDKDPSAGERWGFAELTNGEGGIYANLSYVDFVGLPMGMRLTLGTGTAAVTQTFRGLKQGTLDGICKELRAQGAVDGMEWDQMCVTDKSGAVMRALSPNIFLDVHTTAKLANYFADYVNQVWIKYTTQDLTIDTQSAVGNVTCRVSPSSQQLSCTADSRTYSKPTTRDLLGCNSGPFLISPTDNDVHKAVVARLCAAFNRGTLLLPGGEVQPGLNSPSYYPRDGVHNQYARIVHMYETDGVGYAFSYDDVNPGGQNEAGVVSGANPTLLEVAMGGF